MFELADVLNRHWPAVEKSAHINGWQLRTLGAIKRCRTAEMGGHIDACTSCGTMRISYNSCRNRHCPKCQGKEREKWITKREEDLLPVPYFHSLSRHLSGWCSLCPTCSMHWLCTSRRKPTTACLQQHGKRWRPLVKTPNIWERRPE